MTLFQAQNFFFFFLMDLYSQCREPRFLHPRHPTAGAAFCKNDEKFRAVKLPVVVGEKRGTSNYSPFGSRKWSPWPTFYL